MSPQPVLNTWFNFIKKDEKLIKGRKGESLLVGIEPLQPIRQFEETIAL